jgi:transposase InsO family protein
MVAFMSRVETRPLSLSSEYIEIFYNRQRRQKRLGYLSPAAYKQKYFKERNAA